MVHSSANNNLQPGNYEGTLNQPRHRSVDVDLRGNGKKPLPNKVAKFPTERQDSLTDSCCSFTSDESSVSEDVMRDAEGSNIMPSSVPFHAKTVCCSMTKHCWSHPPERTFQVRGRGYLSNKQKVDSGPSLLKLAGTDLFLTKSPPENISSHCAVMGGHLREAPSFVINMRFSFGVLVFCFEVNQKFLPFLRHRYEPEKGVDVAHLDAMADTMNPAERNMCHFFMANDSQKNSSLKLIPKVVDGPWIVRNVVNGTPVIIGNKLPLRYSYEAADATKGKAQCLEAVLDIGEALKPRAKKVVSICRKYMDLLTVDLGFVIQGDKNEDLPEQVMASVRVHKLSPRLSPELPTAS